MNLYNVLITVLRVNSLLTISSISSSVKLKILKMLIPDSASSSLIVTIIILTPSIKLEISSSVQSSSLSRVFNTIPLSLRIACSFKNLIKLFIFCLIISLPARFSLILSKISAISSAVKDLKSLNLLLYLRAVAKTSNTLLSSVLPSLFQSISGTTKTSLPNVIVITALNTGVIFSPINLDDNNSSMN